MIPLKKKYISFLAYLSLLTGCQGKNSEENHPMTPTPLEQIIRVNNFGPITSLHPHTGISLDNRIFQKALFEGLTRLDQEGKPELAGASFVEISPSETTYTFTLRPMKWSNGERVCSYHFEKAWKLALTPGSNCLRSELFYPIKNAKKVKLGELPLDEVGIRSQGPDILVVELEHATPYFLELVANAIFSPLYDESAYPTVFNGPFRVAEHKPDTQMILEKNPGYWDAANTQLKQIQVSFITDSATALMLYEKGEIDWIGHPFTQLPNDAIARLEKRDDFHSKPLTAVFWLCLNVEKFPLSSPSIRKALSAALNRESLAKQVLSDETPTKTISCGPFNLLKGRELYEDNNPKLAKKLFEEGLKELNLTRETFPQLVLSHSHVAGQKQLAEALQECWEKTLNIDVQLKGAEWNVFFADMGQRDFQIGGYIWYSAFYDPIYYLEFFKDKGARYNHPQWENPHFQNLLMMAEKETDRTIREEHLKQAELLLLEEMPIIPLYVSHAKYLKSPLIHNLTVIDSGHVDFKWARLKQPVEL